MPKTSMLLRRNETAAVEITALAAGAGPPANRIATRRMFDSKCGGRDKVLLMESSDQLSVVSCQWSVAQCAMTSSRIPILDA